MPIKSSNTLSGVVASLGIGQGEAVLVLNSEILSPVPKDKPYVVIADITTPDLVPILVDAQAVVTDIGGLSSHAANIARELGIPCIVDTLYATLRINPGDKVEVNANSNLVTWNSRTDCIFCGKHPGSYLLKSEHFLVIHDGFPVRKGHVLIVPIRHINRLQELTKDEFGDLYNVFSSINELLSHRYHADGYNIGINDGKAAGQTVSHLHIHVIPRTLGDVTDPRGGVRNFLDNPLTEYPVIVEKG